MLNGFTYRWRDVTDWEFARINRETRSLINEGWELDGVVENTAGSSSAGGPGNNISLSIAVNQSS